MIKTFKLFNEPFWLGRLERFERVAFDKNAGPEQHVEGNYLNRLHHAAFFVVKSFLLFGCGFTALACIFT
jgi:hypothetical protein